MSSVYCVSPLTLLSATDHHHHHHHQHLLQGTPWQPSAEASTMPARMRLQGSHQSSWKIGRREVLTGCALAGGASLFLGGAPWPSHAAEAKVFNLPIEKIKEVIEDDIRNGQYYVTGNLTPTIYDDNCRFIDPTTDIQGVDKYVAAVKLLFDPSSSHHELLSIDIKDPHTIQAKWKLEGYLKVPWHPHILPYGGTTQYTVNDKGLIASHVETWEISVWTAFLEFLTPSWKPL